MCAEALRLDPSIRDRITSGGLQPHTQFSNTYALYSPTPTNMLITKSLLFAGLMVPIALAAPSVSAVFARIVVPALILFYYSLSLKVFAGPR